MYFIVSYDTIHCDGPFASLPQHSEVDCFVKLSSCFFHGKNMTDKIMFLIPLYFAKTGEKCHSFCPLLNQRQPLMSYYRKQPTSTQGTV